MSRPKPFTPFSDYLKEKHGQKVHKLSIHAGFTCPNRDGSKGYGGCVYCNNESFSPDAQTSRSVTEQILAGKKHLKATQNVHKFIAYFQSYTNTYAPLSQLKALYDEALAVPDVIGYSVGTRPDCISPEILDLFADYQKQGKEVFVEYGIESGTDKILDLINRLHSVNEFITAVRWAKDRGLRVIAHVILGLPQETEGEMLATVDLLAALDIDGIKIHPLHVVKHTILEAWYKRGQVTLMGQADYVRLTCDTLERLPPRALIMRLHATSPLEILIDPPWCGRKWETLKMIEDEMRRRKTKQGAKFAEARIRGLARLAVMDAAPARKIALPMAVGVS